MPDGRINTDGGVVHYLGIGWAGDCGEPLSRLPGGPEEVAFPSGAAMVVRRSTWERSGGFDSSYFLYCEDLDLGLRLWLADHPVGIVPDARVVHGYEFDKGTDKWFWLERNRWRTVLSVYPCPYWCCSHRLCSGPSSCCWRSPRRRLALGEAASAGRRAPRSPGDAAAATIRSSDEPPEHARFRSTSQLIAGQRVPAGGQRALGDGGTGRLLGGGAAPARSERSLMHVGLDLLFLIPGRTGGRETYARELIAALFELAPSLSATGFINREASPAFARELAASMRVVRLPVSARRPEQWAFGEWLGVPMGGRRGGVDVLHSLANFGPASGPFRRVLTVHDLQYRAVPELLTPGRRLGTAVLMSVAIRRAHRIIAVSAFARDELLREFPVDASSVDVIPNGVGTRIVSPRSQRPRSETGTCSPHGRWR